MSGRGGKVMEATATRTGWVMVRIQTGGKHAEAHKQV